MVSPLQTPLIAQFKQALADCRNLYVDSARRCVREYPQLIEGDPGKFVELMEDLHRGLLAKIFVTVANADKRWSPAEEQYAAVLFEHLWNQRLSGQSLRDALLHVTRQAATIQWYTLFRPFDTIDPLRSRIGELYSVVMRAAQLLAKADGQIAAAETAALTDIRAHLLEIQDVLQNGLRLEPIDYSYRAASDGSPPAAGAQAVEVLSSEASGAHGRFALATASKPQEARAVQLETLEDVLDELDDLIGIRTIKQEIRTLANFLRVQKHREQVGLPTTPLSLHMVFSGNPGTGKTTVARLVGRILKALAILAQGHVVEIDRSGLVAEYAGQTAVKTNKKIDEALDGILFLDEAYSLAAEGGEDPYGSEAVGILLKRMEDDRRRLVVVLAGYPEPMDRLLRSNPGLSSRFNHHITFPDYSPVELGQIFEVFCEENRYVIPPTVRAKLLLGFQWWFDHRDEHFGNGRAVRNAFEVAIRRLANRIIDVVPLTEELLTTFQPEDVVLSGVPEFVWKDLGNEIRPFHVTCPECGTLSNMAQKYLGQRMKCGKCGKGFVAAWGKPV
ncbi:MAG TPA: AAA family ATPase [Thermoguttaceae bacterium]|nr:AAA family ATPase [Thermoguttaceae bacterium]